MSDLKEAAIKISELINESKSIYKKSHIAFFISLISGFSLIHFSKTEMIPIIYLILFNCLLFLFPRLFKIKDEQKKMGEYIKQITDISFLLSLVSFVDRNEQKSLPFRFMKYFLLSILGVLFSKICNNYLIGHTGENFNWYFTLKTFAAIVMFFIALEGVWTTFATNNTHTQLVRIIYKRIDAIAIRTDGAAKEE